MFKLPCCRRKKNQNGTEEVTGNRSSRPRSVSSGRVTISDGPAPKTCASNRSGKTRWLYRLFGRPVDKESPKEPVGHESGPATNTTSGNAKPEKKSGRRSRVSRFCFLQQRKYRVSPAPRDNGEQTIPQTPAPYKVNEVVEFTAPTDDDEEKEEVSLNEAKRVAKEKAQKEAHEEAEKAAQEEAERAAKEKIEKEIREKAVKEARENAAQEKAEKAAREKAQAEAERAAKEKAKEAERAAREKAQAEAERVAREKAQAEAKKLAREKAQSEAERAAREKAQTEAERAAREKAKEAERAAREKAQAEAEKVAREKAQAEAERVAREKAQAEAKKLARERAKKVAREKAAQEQAEKAAQEKAAQAEAEKAAKEKAQAEAERAAKEKAQAEAEKAAREKEAQEQAEKAAREKAAQAEAEKVAREKAQAEAERAAKEKAQAEAQKAARETAKKADREKAAQEKAEKAARERAQAEALKAAKERVWQEVEKIQKQAQRETQKDDEKMSQKMYQTPAKNSSSSSAKPHRVHQGEVTQIISSKSRGDKQGWLGFPNPAMICYINSSLQSLITLGDFIRDISGQEEVWSSVPEAELIRRFMNVVWCHRSNDSRHKLQALLQFKRAVSLQAPEFCDNQQKDAQEFLTTVFDQIRSLSPLLEIIAASTGRIYRCPVEDHLVFRMQNTRTCKRCGAQSQREEDFTNLSLNLVPGGSVQDTLQDYLMETELDFRCDCGAKRSSQQSSFATLPRVLMLHLKRFRFTPLLQLEKLSVPVTLHRELLVTSSQADGWYSLVSVISHLGSGGNTGHYVSDGVHPDVDLDDPFDRWLTYNDSEVTETTGASVCERRQQTAYALFYQRQM